MSRSYSGSTIHDKQIADSGVDFCIFPDMNILTPAYYTVPALKGNYFTAGEYNCGDKHELLVDYVGTPGSRITRESCTWEKSGSLLRTLPRYSKSDNANSEEGKW